MVGLQATVHVYPHCTHNLLSGLRSVGLPAFVHLVSEQVATGHEQPLQYRRTAESERQVRRISMTSNSRASAGGKAM